MVTNFPNGVSSFGVPLPTVGLPSFGTFRIVDPTPAVPGLLGNPNRYTTVQAAITAAQSGDVILLTPGSYNETLTIPSTKTNLALVGAGPRGTVSIVQTTAGAEGLLVSANNVTLSNLSFSGNGTGDYALKLGSGTSGFTATGCRFSGAGAAIVAIDAHTDGLFDDCEFTDGVNGIVFMTANSAQITFRYCRFARISTVHMTDGAVACTNLNVTDCTFDAAANGTEPTDYLTLDTAATSGIFSGNRFAQATNAAATLTIGANVQWGPNGTEAGWSTARPV